MEFNSLAKKSSTERKNHLLTPKKLQRVKSTSLNKLFLHLKNSKNQILENEKVVKLSKTFKRKEEIKMETEKTRRRKQLIFKKTLIKIT